ncbi:TlpA family protein disulfide reductase [Halalkalibaculum sp. DA3122]|uniref:TlpA family protein disulfide reductase n=1 Tax=unclassified Halalkalibaculum TaxID=2964617 RepID=UPI0037546AF3
MKSTVLLVFTLLFVFSCGSEKREAADTQNESSTQSNASEARAVEQAAFTDLEGNTVELSEFEGKVILIDFWETWCKPCLDSFPTMQKLVEEYPDKFVVLAVTPGFTNTVEDARQFAEKQEYDFVYLYDENKLHQKLQVQGIPFKVFVDAEGNFIESSMGSRGPEGDYKHTKEIIEDHS